ncbi:hypothetical protein BJP40_16865 [Streptomyces sp. CC53]|uniref:sigma factor-like helix-turn-helix DNA-binding protein n=1 Tax=unclassified Streptomyces TaxID=2593676 RepID=UPI0008DE20C6|nr:MULTISPECIES: sigma factor-like helix-turn-helix DNA-binding protein [unclassified Streptomyces]OII65430.1 hypothetical protein BJP40_16865 [Streptomyces sp. CC53]
MVHELTRAQATWRGQGWQVEVAGVDTFWVRRLSEVPDATRDLLAVPDRGEAPWEAVSLQVSTRLEGALGEKTRSAIEAVLEARRAQERAAVLYRRTALSLQESGMSGADIAQVLGVSRQRVSQLLKEARQSTS